MRSASSFRRGAGLVAATTVAFSATVLIGPGVAHAALPSWTATASGEQAPIPAGICAVEWTAFGGGAGLHSDGTPGGAAGALTAWVPAEAGEVYTLYPGGAGGDASGLTPGLGGTSADPDPVSQGQDGVSDGEVSGGGGGAASTVVLAGETVISAYGADAYESETVGGYGGGEGVNWAATDDWVDDYDTLGGPGEISGEGIPCMPATPDLRFAEGLDGALRLHFTDGLDGDRETTGFEYTVDGGETWTALADVADDFGLLSAVITGLTNGTEYTVQLRAVDADADSPPSLESDEVTGTPYAPAAAPGNVTAETGDGNVTVSWTAATAGTYPIAGYGVDLRWTNPGGEGGDGAQFCQTTATVFSCTAPAQPGMTHDLYVYAVDAEGNPGEVVEVTSGTVPAPRTVPESDGELTLPAGAQASVAAGTTITFSGSGYLPNSTVTLLLYSTPQILTTVVTDATGSFTVTVTVPAGLAAGQHTLVAAGLDPSGVMRYLTLPITVTAGGAVLAATGADVTAPAIGGLAAVLGGAGLLVVARRRSGN